MFEKKKTLSSNDGILIKPFVVSVGLGNVCLILSPPMNLCRFPGSLVSDFKDYNIPDR